MTTTPSTDETSSQPILPYTLLFLIASLPFLWNLCIERYFSADGVGYFQNLIDAKQFLTFAWSRNHAIYLSQWPLVLGLKLGVTDLTTLKFLFGAGLYFPFIASFALCATFLHGRSPALLLLPIFSLLSITLLGDGIMTGEHHVLTAIVWPIIFILTSTRELKTAATISLFVLLALHSRTYESTVATGLLFSVICLIRILAHTEKKQRIINGVAMLLSLSSVVVAILATVFPRDPNNRSGFMNAILESLANPSFWIAVVFILPCLIGPLTKKTQLLKWGLICSLLLTGIYVSTGHQHYLPLSFSSRALTLFYLPLLLLAAPLLQLRKKAINKTEWSYLLFFTLLCAGSHLCLSRHWVDFRSTFKTELAQHQGYTPIENTLVYQHSQMWGWTNPLLSYIWTDQSSVRTIILNPNYSTWQPFEPSEHVIFTEHRSTELVKNQKSSGSTIFEK